MKKYRVRAYRTAKSFLRAAEGDLKENGVVMEFDTMKEAEQVAEHMEAERKGANAYYIAYRLCDQCGGMTQHNDALCDRCWRGQKIELAKKLGEHITLPQIRPQSERETDEKHQQ